MEICLRYDFGVFRHQLKEDRGIYHIERSPGRRPRRVSPRVGRGLRPATSGGAGWVDAGYVTTAGVQGVSGYLEGGRAWMEPDGFIMAPGDAEAPFMVGDRHMKTRVVTVFSWRAQRGRLAGVSFAPLPEPPFHHVAPDGSGILLAEWSEERPGELSIRLVAPDGVDIKSWTLDVSSVPVPRTVLDGLVQAGRDRVGEVRESVIQRGIPEDQAPSVPVPSEVRAGAYLPEYLPPIRDVRLGLDGTIWLQRTGGLTDGSWVALDPEGTPLFQVRLPPGARLRQTSREALWATMSDDLGVPYVIRWNLVDARADGGDDGSSLGFCCNDLAPAGVKQSWSASGTGATHGDERFSLTGHYVRRGAGWI